MRKYKRNSSGSIFKKILVVFLVIGAVASLGALLGIGNNIEVPNTGNTGGYNYKTVYLVPSRDWAADSSEYSAWCFSDEGFPAAGYVNGNYNADIGAVEFNVPQGYTKLLFIDLKPGTKFNGNWDNKRQQTEDLTLPKDDNVYYHQYANEWRSDAVYTEPELVVTTEEITVMCHSNQMDDIISAYAFNYFTGASEFIAYTYRTEDEPDYDHVQYHFNIPAGYTHIIFVRHSTTEYTWETMIDQSSDLIIPQDDIVRLFNFNTGMWEDIYIEQE